MTTYPFCSALVTGASSGIGEEIATLLGEAGVSTVVVARRTERLDELAARFDGFEVLTADLMSPDGVAAVVERVTDPDRPVDLVVNNAGFGTSGSFVEIDPERLANEIRLNVVALTTISRAALGVMVPRRRGWLLNVSSVASFQPAPGLAVYAATKAYVTNLTESLHEEVRGDGVRVTALCPGLTRTEFQSVSNTGAYVTTYPSFLWTSARQVAATGLADVAAGRALSIPGLTYKTMSLTTGLMPRSLLRRASGLVTRAR